MAYPEETVTPEDAMLKVEEIEIEAPHLHIVFDIGVDYHMEGQNTQPVRDPGGNFVEPGESEDIVIDKLVYPNPHIKALHEASNHYDADMETINDEIRESQ